MDITNAKQSLINFYESVKPHLEKITQDKGLPNPVSKLLLSKINKSVDSITEQDAIEIILFIYKVSATFELESNVDNPYISYE